MSHQPHAENPGDDKGVELGGLPEEAFGVVKREQQDANPDHGEPQHGEIEYNAGMTAHWDLVVIGGGTLIDETKVWRLEQSPELTLIAIPSIWGSGAEASPIAVRNRGGKKDIRVDKKLLPDARAVWPELAATISPERVRFACGDSWSHVQIGRAHV